MKNKELNLNAMYDFLNRTISITELTDELNRIYNSFTMAFMKLSAIDGFPVDRDDVDSAITLNMLLEVFKTIKNDNESE